PKYRHRGGLFQAPGCAPYSLAASDEWSSAMGTEEHAAVAAGGDPQGIDTARPDGYVVSLQDAGETQVAVAGGKGAHLGVLSRIDGIGVPPGFAVTTSAFRGIMEEAPSIDARLERLSRLSADDGDGIRTLSGEIR